MNVPENIVSIASMVVEEVDDQSESSDEQDVIPLDGSSDYIGSTTSVISPDRIIGSSPDNLQDVGSNIRSADYITLRNEQLTDSALTKYWDMARAN